MQNTNFSSGPDKIFLSLSIKTFLLGVLILIASLTLSSCKWLSPPDSPTTTSTTAPTTSTTASTTTTTEPSTTTTTTPGTTTSSTSSSTTTSTGSSTTTTTPGTTTAPATSTTTPTTTTAPTTSTTTPTTTTAPTTSTTTPTTTTAPTTSTTTTTVTCADEIDVALNPTSGKINDFIDVQISISDNCTPIDAFGLVMTFDPTIFAYISTSAADLTAGWINVGGNENFSGNVTVGGFHTTAIPTGSSGQIATVRLKVICAACSTGNLSVIQIQIYSDDISAMNPQPDSATFTYQALLLFPGITLFP